MLLVHFLDFLGGRGTYLEYPLIKLAADLGFSFFPGTFIDIHYADIWWISINLKNEVMQMLSKVTYKKINSIADPKCNQAGNKPALLRW